MDIPYVVVARQLPLKGPCNETNPNDYLTEIQVPVKKL